MSSWPVPSVLDAGTQTFPTLNAAQIGRARASGKLRKVEPGEILFRPGEASVPFFVLLSGKLEIIQSDLSGERVIVTHGPGAFTGELSMISGQRCLALGRVSEAGEFLEISSDGLRSIIARDAELSEIMMRAFILRRLALITHNLRSIVKLNCDRRPYQVVLDDGGVLSARAIVIATGAQYNKPAIPNLKKLEGQGVYYGGTYMESQLCEGEDVIVVGGGNSAGQAAVYLSRTVRKVHMLVRSGGLAETMSRYLIQRIAENPKIELHCKTEITSLEGDTELERVGWIDKRAGQTSTHEIRHLLIMTGASPRTEWLRGCLALDDKGFILTGRDLDASVRSDASFAGSLHAHRRYSRPAFPVFLPSETLVPVTSSALPQA